MDREAVLDVVGEADLLLDVSGHLPPGSPLRRIPVRVYLDVDPGFTQMWARQVDLHLAHHTHFFTVGQNVGGPDCPVPSTGSTGSPPCHPWRWTPRPIAATCPGDRILTVGDWRGSQVAVWNGEWYGGKREEFLGFLRVPVEADVPLHLVLCIGRDDHEDLGVLTRAGWRVEDPYVLAGDPHSYRELVQGARAEFSVARRGDVRTRSGWVSDRTACFLASGARRSCSPPGSSTPSPPGPACSPSPPCRRRSTRPCLGAGPHVPVLRRRRLRSSASTVAWPHSAIVRSTPDRSRVSTWSTPASPPAPSP